MTSPKTSASTSSTVPGGVDAEPAPVAAVWEARAAIGPAIRETNAGEREQVAGPRAGTARGTATGRAAREAQQEATQPADSTASDGPGERGAGQPGAAGRDAWKKAISANNAAKARGRKWAKSQRPKPGMIRRAPGGGT